jgi:hypothetical protein
VPIRPDPGFAAVRLGRLGAAAALSCRQFASPRYRSDRTATNPLDGEKGVVMMKGALITSTAAMLACLATTALADWEDNFDSYANGQMLDGGADDGGWKGWDNNPAWGAPVSNEQAYSSPHSVKIVPTADLVHEYAGYESGEWLYVSYLYVPPGFSGGTSFMLLGEYADFGSENSWQLWLEIRDDGTIISNNDDV